LPDSIGNLSALTIFTIYKYEKLKHTVLPNSICFCKNLQSILISNINMLPPSMILLEKLTEIIVYNNNNEFTRYNINELRLLWVQKIKGRVMPPRDASVAGSCPRATI